MFPQQRHALLALILSGAVQALASTGPACARLEALSNSAELTEKNYAQGSCAVEQHRYRDAIGLLTALVAQDPWPVYRAELGRAYLGAQEFEQARKQFLAALDSHPPEEARRLLEVYLRMAEQEQTQAKEWFGSASLGYVYDSNVNAGPKSPQVTLYGLPFTMSDSAMPKSDMGLRAQLAGVHIKPLGAEMAWQSNASAEWLRYDTWTAYNSQQLNVDSGPQFNVRHGRLGLYVPLGMSRTWIGNVLYSRSTTLTPQVRMAVGESSTLNLGLNRLETEYSNSDVMSSVSHGAFVQWRHTLSNNWTWEPGLRYLKEHANDEAYSNQRWTASLALRGTVAARMRLHLEASASRVHYQGMESWASEPRRDTRLSYQVALSKDLPGGYYLTLAWQRSRTLSNLELYNSERQQIQIQISRVF